MDARLILDPAASGAQNMARDEALREWVEAHGRPLLRFYRWSPATLSLGYFQSLADRHGHAGSRPLAVVRRASGGGAIVHDHELTYSFAAPVSNRFRDRAADLVSLFHQTLIEALRDWGVHAARCQQSVVHENEPFLCFLRRARDDVLIEDAKVAGSAQRRHHTCVLQHGSVLLRASSFAGELPGIAEASQAQIPGDQLQQAWMARIEERLGLHLAPSQWTPDELSRSQWWQARRYAARQWTAKR